MSHGYGHGSRLGSPRLIRPLVAGAGPDAENPLALTGREGLIPVANSAGPDRHWNAGGVHTHSHHNFFLWFA